LHIIIYINYIYIHTYINSYSIDRCPHNFSCSRAEFVTPPPKKLKKNTSSLLPYSARILPTFMIHRYISPSLYYIHIIYIQTYIYISENILYIHTISLRYRAIFPCCSCMYIIYYSWYYYILASFFLCLEYSRIFFLKFSPLTMGFLLYFLLWACALFSLPIYPLCWNTLLELKHYYYCYR